MDFSFLYFHCKSDTVQRKRNILGHKFSALDVYSFCSEKCYQMKFCTCL